MTTLHRQQGITLIMALIMLVVLTLLALTSFNMNQSNLQVVSNMQQREEALAAAREVIEETISSTDFFKSPASALKNPCDGAANTRCVDVNGDGTTDVTVAITPAPACVKAQPIKSSDLDLSVEEDLACSLGASQNFGTEGANTGNSTCANSVWEIHAVATDVVTEAQVEVTQGVAVRVAEDDLTKNCPTT